jgi:iron complex outermembrane receptor protein
MNFKKLLTLLLLISSVSFAQNTLKGTLKENGKIPVIGATVKLSTNSETKNTLSNINGNFEFTNLIDQNYKLTISSIGYEAFSQEVKANQTLEISLKPSETLLQDVEVLGRARKDYNSDYSFSATKIAIKNKELPQALSTVTKELIADRGAFQLADAVKIASGVSPSSFYNQYNIRGISQNEEGQIINGMRTRQFYFLQQITTNLERV